MSFTESQQHLIARLVLVEAERMMMGDSFAPGGGEWRKQVVDDALAVCSAILAADADLAEDFDPKVQRLTARRQALITSGAFPPDSLKG